MKKAKCIIEKDYVISETDPRLFGSFIEHLGRAVYSGIYEPGHPSADEQGFRRDVLGLVKELAVPLVRYPGGNFVSGYQWTDGIGPLAERPKRLDLAWRSIETNEIGIDEFADWCKKADSGVMAAVNLGTGTPADAGNLVEYCNHPGGTYWSDLRRRNGHAQPHGIKVWCLGNEMDGPWQICHLSADDYGKKALEAAKIMRWVDPGIELVACGSSNARMATFPEWDRIVLEHLYDQVDYISLHSYYGIRDAITRDDFLGSFVDMDRFIQTIIATADYVKAKNRSHKRLNLSFDEWNVWYLPEEYPDWETAPPRLEQIYTFLDALVFGGLICSLLNHADRIKIACLAQLVNAIAPIYTKRGGPAIRQTIFYPFQQVSQFGRGQVLRPLIHCPAYESQAYGDVPVLQTAVVFNPESGAVNLFLLNCDQHEDLEVQLDFRSFPAVRPVEHRLLQEDELAAANDFEAPERVKPRQAALPRVDGNIATVVLPKLSWNMLRFTSR
ncbi:alpha-N-arabinofuranosidase [Hydrogenispora ethanolica]|uniref:non-reducing end alpha-L-arabinofuranosidase n=1 Tax=Hydrogenispora ethanolica TaxID=1082276 RepID=A0A4R1SAM0_HYDET|nr:alpha-N-arabinofuranosidase [Hydrogenispora ethanolica]TCL76409.1 alpha-N-arabinofuranosidase [Hydrogenispora ethanolica]